MVNVTIYSIHRSYLFGVWYGGWPTCSIHIAVRKQYICLSPKQNSDEFRWFPNGGHSLKHPFWIGFSLWGTPNFSETLKWDSYHVGREYSRAMPKLWGFRAWALVCFQPTRAHHCVWRSFQGSFFQRVASPENNTALPMAQSAMIQPCEHFASRKAQDQPLKGGRSARNGKRLISGMMLFLRVQHSKVFTSSVNHFYGFL